MSNIWFIALSIYALQWCSNAQTTKGSTWADTYTRITSADVLNISITTLDGTPLLDANYTSTPPFLVDGGLGPQQENFAFLDVQCVRMMNSDHNIDGVVYRIQLNRPLEIYAGEIYFGVNYYSNEVPPGTTTAINASYQSTAPQNIENVYMRTMDLKSGNVLNLTDTGTGGISPIQTIGYTPTSGYFAFIASNLDIWQSDDPSAKINCPVNDYIEFVIGNGGSTSLPGEWNICELYVWGLDATYAPSAAPTTSDPTGAPTTADPTSNPTLNPTDPTSSPTMEPTLNPTDGPTRSPTKHPTPDTCEEHVVHQSCCGHYHFIIEEDTINLRNNSDPNCINEMVAHCCGNDSVALTLSSTTLYGCGGSLDGVICDVSDWDQSRIIGTVIDGKLNSFPTDDTGIPLIQLYDLCYCDWTIDECNGTDTAVCGAQYEYNDLFDDECWLWNETWTPFDDFIDEQCYIDYVAANPGYAKLAWEPCSADAFIGSVSAVVNASNELIHAGDCGCTYFIKDCRLYDSNVCTDDDSCTESITSCCAQNETGGVLSGTNDAWGYPLSWTCSNYKEICPDIWNATRYYDVEETIDWWYDGDTDRIENRCQCRYTLDEYNYPPTPGPTAQPTTTYEPTKEPIQVTYVYSSDPAIQHQISIISAIVVFVIYVLH